MSNFTKDIELLPNYFKKVALILFSLSIPFLIVIEWVFALGIEGDQAVVFLKSTGMLCYLIFFLSKEKTEDELISKIRMKSIGVGFLTGITSLAVTPYFNFLSTGNFSFDDVSVLELTFIMIFVNIVFFYVLKWWRT